MYEGSEKVPLHVKKVPFHVGIRCSASPIASLIAFLFLPLHPWPVSPPGVACQAGRHLAPSPALSVHVWIFWGRPRNPAPLRFPTSTCRGNQWIMLKEGLTPTGDKYPKDVERVVFRSTREMFSSHHTSAVLSLSFLCQLYTLFLTSWVCPEPLVNVQHLLAHGNDALR